MSKKPKSLLYGDHRPRTGPEYGSWLEAIEGILMFSPVIGIVVFFMGGVIFGSQVCRWFFPISLVLWLGFWCIPREEE